MKINRSEFYSIREISEMFPNVPPGVIYHQFLIYETTLYVYMEGEIEHWIYSYREDGKMKTKKINNPKARVLKEVPFGIREKLFYANDDLSSWEIYKEFDFKKDIYEIEVMINGKQVCGTLDELSSSRYGCKAGLSFNDACMVTFTKEDILVGKKEFWGGDDHVVLSTKKNKVVNAPTEMQRKSVSAREKKMVKILKKFLDEALRLHQEDPGKSLSKLRQKAEKNAPPPIELDPRTLDGYIKKKIDGKI